MLKPILNSNSSTMHQFNFSIIYTIIVLNEYIMYPFKIIFRLLRFAIQASVPFLYCFGNVHIFSRKTILARVFLFKFFTAAAPCAGLYIIKPRHHSVMVTSLSLPSIIYIHWRSQWRTWRSQGKDWCDRSTREVSPNEVLQNKMFSPPQKKVLPRVWSTKKFDKKKFGKWSSRNEVSPN